MRRAALEIVVVAILAAPGCGYATSPSPAKLFALDAGNYTLTISGSGLCSGAGTSPREGSASATVARAGNTWSVRSVQTSDTFAMSFTTDGAADGSARGEVSGSFSSGAGLITAATGAVTGTNSAANVAGGPITNPGGTASFVVNFSQPSGGGSCSSGTWTLTPR